MDKKSRYPGIRSFEQEEEELFFGRKKESRELYSIIKVERFVVLFAKSGIGKTSLLNAGVLPHLEEEDYYPIKVRFQNTNIPPLKMLHDAVEMHIQQEGMEQQVKERLDQLTPNSVPTLWEYLKAISFEQNDMPATPILVFDQFEEFFMHSAEEQQPFIDCLADIVYERVPDEIYDQLRKIPRKERTREQRNWVRPLDWKIIFSIRSDRLSLLDNLSEHIPAILDNRYQLRPLRREQALAAIVSPAKMPGSNFTTPPFEYTKEALQMIIENLSNERGEVESFQLQVICQHIEQNIISQQLDASGA